jgi:hypothetical protein
MAGPLVESPLQSQAPASRELQVPDRRAPRAVHEVPNPALSLLPRMSVAAILDDAMGVFGIPVSEHLQIAWRRLVELVNQLDVMVDGMDSGRQQELLLGVAGVAEGGAFYDLAASFERNALVAVDSFADACDDIDLEDPCRRAWSGHFKALAFEHSVGHRISDVDEYILHRCQTGSLLGLMFADLLPLRDRVDGYDRIVRWVGSLGACAELIDSFWDLPEDYRRGHAAVVPNVRNRAALAHAARTRASLVLDPVPRRLRAKLTAKVLLMGINRSGRLNRFRTAA